MLKILIVAAVISIAISMVFEENKALAWVEGAAILVAVAVVSLVTAFNDYKKESQFIALNKFSDSKNVIKVKRQGEEMEINIDDLKVGDLAKIQLGMQIPCDAILVQGTSVAVDESAMTGESDELKKETLLHCLSRKEEFEMDNKELLDKIAQHIKEAQDDEENKELQDKADAEKNKLKHALPSPLLLSGTQIKTGEGWFLIVVVGKNSCVGKIREKLEQKGAEMTPLQEKLEAIATDIGKLGMVCAYITVMVLFIRFWIEKCMEGYDWSENIGTYLGNWF